ncbi:MAG: polyketide cyclase [Gammaproteobacteria bacterium]|nr:MAG: polyketide cyclase [Gammaproteobacteria bacterium]
MKKEIHTKIIIHSIPQKVWENLADFENYPSWNPFIKEISGKLKIAEKIKVKIQPENASAMTFRPTIVDCEENKRLIWKGKFIIGGLFDGKHQFELLNNQNGTTTFIHSEVFSGILVRFFNPENTEKGFEKMNQKLKEICE